MSAIDAGELDTCERVLDMVGDRAEALVRVASTRGGLTRFATSFIHQNVAEDATTVAITLAVDGRVASATTTDTSDAALARLLDATLEAARVRPADPYYAGLAPPSEPSPVDHWDDATADADPAARAAVVAAFVDAIEAAGGGGAAGGAEAAGYCATTASVVALATSAGLRRRGRTTSADLSGVARIDGAEGRGGSIAASLTALDGSAAGTQAGDTARAALDPVEIDAGEYEVVLETGCVASILDFFSLYGFNAKMHAEGQSFVHLGDEQFDPAVALWDDVADPRAIGLGFDADGVRRRRLDLIDAGRSVALAYDRRTAHREGAEPTGHGMGDASSGAVCTNLFLASGDRSHADLVAGVERGLQVHGFWYLRPLDPKTLVVTGLTRGGVFLIEGGRITRSVANLRFTQSFVAALGPGRVLGIGADAALAAGDLSSIYGFAHHVAPLHLRSWRFTGGASG